MEDNFYTDRAGNKYYWNGEGYYNSKVDKYFVFYGNIPAQISPDKLKIYLKEQENKRKIEKELSDPKNTANEKDILQDELNDSNIKIANIERETVESENEDLLKYQKELDNINKELSYIETTDDNFDYLTERKQELEEQIDSLDTSKMNDETYNAKRNKKEDQVAKVKESQDYIEDEKDKMQRAKEFVLKNDLNYLKKLSDRIKDEDYQKKREDVEKLKEERKKYEDDLDKEVELREAEEDEDMSFDNEKEAREFFDSYTGFEDEDNFETSDLYNAIDNGILNQEEVNEMALKYVSYDDIIHGMRMLDYYTDEYSSVDDIFSDGNLDGLDLDRIGYEVLAGMSSDDLKDMLRLNGIDLKDLF